MKAKTQHYAIKVGADSFIRAKLRRGVWSAPMAINPQRTLSALAGKTVLLFEHDAHRVRGSSLKPGDTVISFAEAVNL